MKVPECVPWSVPPVALASVAVVLAAKEAPPDPIADLAIVRMVDLNWTERASTQVGRIIGTVPREYLTPFLHQRYDDLSVLGAGRD